MDVKDEETLEQRQEVELDVLKSIYDRDIQDLRELDVWKISRPPEFLLTLRPNHTSRRGANDAERVSLDLHVRFSEKYPESAPVFIAPKTREGNFILSEEDLAELKKIIRDHVTNNLGEVMIMDVALKVSSWLTDIDQRPRFKSCYEEMEARHEKLKVQEALKQREEKAHVEKQRELIQQEIARAAEQIKEGKLQKKEESRRKRESSLFMANNALSNRRRSSMRSSLGGGLWSESSDVNPDDAPMEQVYYMSKGEKVLVNKGSRIGGGNVHYGIVQHSGRMVAISTWTFKTHPENKKVCFIDPSEYYDEATLLRQVASIEQEMSSILKIQRDHPRIAQYMGMSCANTGKSLILRVFEEFIPGSNLSYYLMENIPMDLVVLRYFSIGILEALDYMHEKNVVHRDLRDTSVFVTNGGCIKVSNWSWDKRIRDLLVSETLEAADGAKFPSAIGRGGKKVDIYRFGILALSLSNGFIVQDAVPSIPKSLGPEFVDFLRKCFLKDERNRWTAGQLLEHGFLKEKVLPEGGLPPLEAAENDASSFVGRPSEPPKTESDEDEDETLRLYNPPLTRGVSRLNDEFELISRIGKGGFGEVIKVRNRLDGQTYAIKKIKLNPRDKSVTKKIMREVKLLSRLNHENVVRYYNSWMEVATLEADSEEESDELGEDSATAASDSSSLLSLNRRKRRDISCTLKTPQDLNQEFSLSYSSHQFPVFEDEEETSEGGNPVLLEDETEVSDDEVFGTSFLPNSWGDDDDEDIVFQEASFESADGEPPDKPPQLKAPRVDNGQIVLSQFLYIQMELCDKQTLRNAIDRDLFKDMKRVWRMFREIIEGLLHIHSQGMIHRDLKPVNIFIDSSDHVKIGDFGLATSSGMTKGSEKNDFNESSSLEVSMEAVAGGGSGLCDLTGQIGTAMYIAPEVQKMRTSVYNQKVDIYSLGIIFFEMCYHPLKTGMERIKILTDLRSEEILFPPDFDDEHLLEQQGYLIHWLLAHDPIRRPSSYELLQSDYLPPPQVEEAEIRELVRHTLCNKQSKTYHHLIDAVLAQRMGLADDLKYDLEIPKVPPAKRKRILFCQERVRTVASSVFRRHGAVCVNVPIFMPKGRRGLYDPSRDNLVEVMTRNGGVVSLPHDLRLHFARYLAKSSISTLKRYCIAPVYREEAVFGVTPKELIECAFDIASPEPGGLLADAEVILVVDELIRELGNSHELNYYFVRLNHVLLLRGLLSHCGVLEEESPVVYDILRERRLTKMERHKRLLNIGLSDQVISSLAKFLEREGSIQEISSHFRHITKRSTPAGNDVKKAVSELSTIISHCRAFGVEIDLAVAPSLVYNPGHFSGMFCHVVKKKPNYHKTKQCDVIAAGGRYDGILNGFYADMSLCSDPSLTLENYNYSAVGVSISMDKISMSHATSASCADVLLVSMRPAYPRERCEVAKRIWSLGLSCYLVDASLSLDEAQDLFLEIGASALVLIVGNEKMEIRLKFWYKRDSRFVEKKLPLSDLSEFLSQYFAAQESDELTEEASGGCCSSSSPGGREANGPLGGGGGNGPSLNSSSGGSGPSSCLLSKVRINLKFLDKQRYTSSQKKRLESAITSRINGSLGHFGPSNLFEVLGLPLPGSVVKSLAAFLELESEFKFENSIKDVTDRHIRYRKELASICDEIHELKFIKHVHVIVLYSCDDHMFKFLVS